MIRQIYCQENNTCVAIPLQKRKVIKKSLRAIYPLLLLLILIVLTVKIDIIPVLKDADMSDVLTLSLQPLALLIFALFIPIY